MSEWLLVEIVSVFAGASKVRDRRNLPLWFLCR